MIEEKKGGAAVLKIKEAAETIGISTRTIRFYEEKGLIHPKKEKENQYRIFQPSDIEILKTITALREIDMPLATVKLALDQFEKGNYDDLESHLARQQLVLFNEWTELKDVLQAIGNMMESINNGPYSHLKDLQQIAVRLKTLKDMRRNWEDRWNFDGQAKSYDEQVYCSVQNFNVHQDYDQALDLAKEWIHPKKNEFGLDIGIGTGNLAGRFLKSGVNMCGVDQSEEMLKKCREKFPEIQTKLGHFLALPYQDHSFDFIVTSYALHHLDDSQKELSLMDISRILKQGGRICITDLMFENGHDRRKYFDRWMGKGREDILRSIQDEYYADRAHLLEFLKQRGFLTKHQKINEILHIIYAEKNE